MASIRRSINVCEMTAAEVKVINLDFSDSENLDSTETLSTIAAPSVSPSGSLTATNETVSGQVAQVQLQSGTVNTDYTVMVKVTTSTGQTLNGQVLVQVRG